MPSFDIVSEIDKHELSNAIDQANREVSTRFDLKGTGAEFQLEKETITLSAQNDFQVKQMYDILVGKLAKRNIDIRCLDVGKVESNLSEARQKVTVKQGIDKEFGKKLTKLIKDSNLKVQASIQGEQVRVTGKKRDDLQDAIALMKKTDLEMPLQFVNFRD